jgi:hypothetical protein
MAVIQPVRMRTFCICFPFPLPFSPFLFFFLRPSPLPSESESESESESLLPLLWPVLRFSLPFFFFGLLADYMRHFSNLSRYLKKAHLESTDKE